MAESGESGALERAISASGLVAPGSTGLVLLSGGADSVGLLWGLTGLLGPEGLLALHVNYGLRPDSDRDQEICDELCREMGVELVTVRAGRPEGNLHDWARDLRYGEAEALADRLDLDWIAVGHTRTDLAETVLYRLASSPGTRALRAMPARRGRIIRPLLDLGRDQVREQVERAGLPFVDDPSNLDPGFARARIRSAVTPVLSGINPAYELNVARTLAEIEEEALFLEAEARTLIGEGPGGRPAIAAPELLPAPPAVARHALRLLVERSTGRAAPVSIARTESTRELAGRPEGGSVDLGGGLRLEVGSGFVLAEGPEDRPAAPSELPIPGVASWDGWLFGAEGAGPDLVPRGPEVATLDRSGLGGGLAVRAWRPGDRIRPLGMTGSKKVADLMAEKGLPRPRRPEWPVVESGGEIAWVPGIAVSESFRIGADTGEAVLLTAESPGLPVTSDRGTGT